MAADRDWRTKGHVTGRRPEARGVPVEDSVDRETEAYFEMLVEDLVAEGWDPAGAREEAKRRFGDLSRVREESRAMMERRDRKVGLGMFFDALRWDTLYALRTLWRTPGFSLIVIFILAIGIGTNVAIFSMLKGLVLRPLPFPEPDRVVAVWETEIGQRGYQPMTSPDYYDMLEQQTCFEEFGLYNFTWVNVLVGSEPERVQGAVLTASVLRALGIPPAIGRLFTDGDEAPENDNIVILSDAYWKQRFAGDSDLVGERITVDGESYQVVGIMPDYFEFPSPWGVVTKVEVFRPQRFSREQSQRGWHSHASLARLKDGVTAREAETELRTISARLAELYPDTNARVQVWIDPLMHRALGGVTTVLVLLLMVVAFVLLIACANVSSMLLARGATRHTEIAIRSTLGAGGGRLIRQLLTESMVLALLGGVVGTVAAYWSLGTLKGLLPGNVPRVAGIEIDGWVLLFAFLVMAAAGVLFGLVPAIFAARTDLVSAMKGTGGSGKGGQRRNKWLSALVVGQLATALMLVNSAILLFLSYVNVAQLRQGFDTEEVLVAGLQLTGGEYAERENRILFWNALVDRLDASPGIAVSGVTTKLPTQGGTNGSMLAEGQTYDPDARLPLVEYSYVTPGYFEAMGIDLLAGRGLRQEDMVEPAEGVLEHNVVVNEALAQRYWPDESAIGRRLRDNERDPQWFATVVGVVEDVRQWGITYPPLPEIYRPLTLSGRTYCYAVVRAEGDPYSVVPVVHGAVGELDPLLPVASVTSMETLVTSGMRSRRLYTVLIGLFTFIAVALSLAGTYGVMSFHVTQRKHEVGVRVALGASKAQVQWHFLRRGMKLTLLGGGVGVWFAFMGTAAFSSIIFGIRPLQILYLLAAMVVLLIVVTAATLVPAWRATRVDPVDSLRVE